ncbi:MAG: lamin tail domain-containing protein [Candidatus Eisenbacteria bacterium]|nr:lamin tail domain-containing protein [Candidatus Eisenbacteria bacterium]
MRPPVALLRAALLLFCLLAASPASSSVLISELCDPRDNYLTDRFIEIYNSGTDPVDLTNWSLVAVANNVVAYTWPLSGVINPGQALVAGNSTTVAVFTVNFPGAWSTANANWNGKVGDGAKLINPSGAAVDIVVATGTLFENADLVRKPTVTEPNTTYTPAEWTSAAVILATNASPGSHGGAPPASGPAISGVVTTPPLPSRRMPSMSANVVDTTATISTVTLLWGTAPGSLANLDSDGAPLGGTTFRTTATIPAQAEGTTVYYEIQATNSAATTTNSSVRSYFLPYSTTIHQIQGEATTSPFAGLGVVTRGVVTARLGTCFVIQEGAGPWSGLWVRSSATPAVGDSIAVRGQITESDAQGLAGNTLLTSAVLIGTWPGASVPAPAIVPDSTAASEPYEGVLVAVTNAACTNSNVGGGVWRVDDGSGPLLVDPTGYAMVLTSERLLSGDGADGIHERAVPASTARRQMSSKVPITRRRSFSRSRR